MKKSFTKTIFCICLLVGFCLSDLQAQSIHLSQPFNQPLFLNPALTGNDANHSRIGLTYRNQWASIPAPYETLIASFDIPILTCKKKGGYFGLGTMIYREASGDGVLRENSGTLSIAYHRILTPKWHLSLGSQMGYTHKKVDFTKLTFPAQISNFQINPNLPNSGTVVSDNFGYFNTRLGLNSTYKLKNIGASIQVGISYDHSFEPNQTFLTVEGQKNELDGIWIFYIRETFKLGSALSVDLLGLNMKQAHNSLNLFGLSLGHHFEGIDNGGNAIHVGAGYRVNDAVILSLGADLGSVSLTGTYDINISDLDIATNNQEAIEVSLVYRGLSKNCN